MQLLDIEALDPRKDLIEHIVNKTLLKWKNAELDLHLERLREFDSEIPIKSHCRVKAQKVKALEESLERYIRAADKKRGIYF